jgi:predicted Zn-ribbon and HTH transcriptional regulator
VRCPLAKKKIKPKQPAKPPEADETQRHRLEVLLSEESWSVEGLRRLLRLPARDLEEELEHLDRSLRRRGSKIEIEPAECIGCGHVFEVRKARRFHAPTRCPKCKEERIHEPRFHIEG